MKAELRVLNALIGMSRSGGYTWPTTLHDMGYELVAVEREIGMKRDRETQTIVPEAVFYSRDAGVALPVESKSKSFDERQARGYCIISAHDLKEFGVLPPDADDAVTVAPIYFTERQHVEELGGKVDLFNEQEVQELPLVDYDNHRFRITFVDGDLALPRGKIRDGDLNDVFCKGISFPHDKWPTQYVPFDLDSDAPEVLPAVIAPLQAFLMNGQEQLSASDILGGSNGSSGVLMHWQVLSGKMQRQYMKKVYNLIELFRVHYVAEYIAPHPKRRSWTKTKTVTSTRQMEAISSSLADFRGRMRDGKELPKDTQSGTLFEHDILDPEA